jgi:Glycosyltransferase family 87
MNRDLLLYVFLGVLFLVPFFDPRRPIRLLHLDLLVLLCFGAIHLAQVVDPYHRLSHEPWITAGRLTYIIGIVYLVARLLLVGFGEARRGRLVPLVPVRWLAVGLAAVMAFRAGYTLIDQTFVVDVGGATVVGADLIAKGHGIYEGEISNVVQHGDTYGPVNYLLYIPFEQALPWTDPRDPSDVSVFNAAWSDADAARVATVAWDLLIVLALLVVGRRLRPGRDGAALGVALAWAWATFPYAFFVLRYSYNDGLMVALMLGAFIAVAHPIRRGVLLGLAAAAKFAPLALAPLFAVGVRGPRLRSAALFTVTLVAVLIIVFVPFLPDGGPGEIYDRTLGYQRSYCCSVWDQQDLSWLELPARLAAATLALLVAIRPPTNAGRLAARAGAVMAAVVLTTSGWWPNYVVWCAPFALIGLFAEYATDATARVRPDRREEITSEVGEIA